MKQRIIMFNVNDRVIVKSVAAYPGIRFTIGGNGGEAPMRIVEEVLGGQE